MKSANKITITYIIFFAIFVLLAANYAEAAEKSGDKVIVIGGSNDFPPYSFIDENGKPSGFVTDLTLEWARAANYKIEFRLGEWTAVLDDLKNKRIDVIQDIFYARERESVYDFSTPYIVASYGIITKKGAPYIKIEDLPNKKIIITAGDIVHKYLLKNNITNITTSPTWPGCLKMLDAGGYECAIMEKLPGLYWMNKNSHAGLVLENETLFPNKLCYAVAEGDSEIIGKINEELAILKKNGTYEELYNKWFGVYKNLEPSYSEYMKVIENVFYSLLVILFILGVVLLWNFSLKRSVDLKTAELKAQNESLVESETRYSLLANTSHDYISEFDENGAFKYINSVCEKMGYIREELIGRQFREIVHPDDFEVLLHLFYGVFVKKEDISGVILRINNKNGEWRWFENAGTIFNKTDREPRMIFTSRDITDYINIEDDLKKKIAELEQFAYVSSHDLKEPLRMIGSFSQLLVDRYKGKLDENADKFLSYIIEGALRMQTLINDLLSYSRTSNAEKKFDRISCGEVFNRAVTNLKIAIEESGAVVKCAELPVVYGDMTLLTQLFQNLIQNAIKFKGKSVPEITISVEKEDDFYRFEFKDNGIGIKKEFYEKIFVIFQRLHARSHYSGNGIGLSICKKIVERHGGRIWVESVLNEGSSFYFTLPAA